MAVNDRHVEVMTQKAEQKISDNNGKGSDVDPTHIVCLMALTADYIVPKGRASKSQVISGVTLNDCRIISLLPADLAQVSALIEQDWPSCLPAHVTPASDDPDQDANPE